MMKYHSFVYSHCASTPKMKFFILAVAVLYLATVGSSQPIASENEELQSVGNEQVVEPLTVFTKGNTRVKRFTCDVLSAEAAGTKFNHSACALHCLALGKSGGYCNDRGVCVCR